MRYKKGQSGNPKGRPKGQIDKRVKYSEMLKEHAPNLINKLVQLALDGDTSALKVCIERIIPKPRSEPISIHVDGDRIEDLTYLMNFNYNLIRDVAQGKEIGDNVKALSDMISNQVNLVEKAKMEKQLDRITDELEKDKHL